MSDAFDPASTRIPVPGTANLRDLGGYPTRDGRALRPGRFFRSECLSYPGADEALAIWDAAHRPHFERLRLRTVIDLRAPKEHASDPSAWTEATGARIVSLPILEGGEGSDTYFFGDLLAGKRSSFVAEDMSHFYEVTVQRQAEVFGEVVRVLADPGNAPVLVHCSAGKDRTGITVALILDALGVPRDLVIRDYALTQQFRPNRVELHAATFDGLGVALDDVRVLFETPPEVMEATLTHVDEAYGGARFYFRDACGVDPLDLAALQRNLLGPTSQRK